MSLPSRGAWIEITGGQNHVGYQQSLPSRGAWIEIMILKLPRFGGAVAPLAGSVDRNSCQQAGHGPSRGRSPRGERG